MAVSDARKLRQLTWAHLKRPDPVSWLLAADLLEESGLDAEAAKWRWRAESLPALEYAIETGMELRRNGVDQPDSQFALVGCGSLLRLVKVEAWYTYVTVYLLRDESGVLKGRWEGGILLSRMIYLSEPKEKQTKMLLEFIDGVRLRAAKEAESR